MLFGREIPVPVGVHATADRHRLAVFDFHIQVVKDGELKHGNHLDLHVALDTRGEIHRAVETVGASHDAVGGDDRIETRVLARRDWRRSAGAIGRDGDLVALAAERDEAVARKGWTVAGSRQLVCGDVVQHGLVGGLTGRHDVTADGGKDFPARLGDVLCPGEFDLPLHEASMVLGPNQHAAEHERGNGGKDGGGDQCGALSARVRCFHTAISQRFWLIALFCGGPQIQCLPKVLHVRVKYEEIDIDEDSPCQVAGLAPPGVCVQHSQPLWGTEVIAAMLVPPKMNPSSS